MAATTLSGFLQCSFLSMDPPMQAHFEALCKTRLPKKRKRELGSIVDTIPSAGRSPNYLLLHAIMSAPLIIILINCFPLVDLVRRHAGVLGLSACILSSPYDVPTWMPQLLMDLSAHLNDTQPIEVSELITIILLVLKGGAITWARVQMTVKKTLSNFRRTHHDNWQQHKQQFTDDQLLVLTDLLVSPCYYAWNLVNTLTSQTIRTQAHPKDGKSAGWVTQFVFHRHLPHCEGSPTPEQHPEGLKSVFMYLAP